MNPLTLLFRLPLLPLQGVIRLAQLIQEDAERELADPGTVRRELEELEQAQASGAISDHESAELQRKVVGRYLGARQGTPATAGNDEG